MPFFNFPKDDVRAEYHQSGDALPMVLKINRGIDAASERNLADVTLTGAGAGRNFVAQLLYTDENAAQLKQPIIPTNAARVIGARDATEQGLNVQVARLIAGLVAATDVAKIHKVEVAGSSDAQTYMALIIFQIFVQAQPEPE